MLYILDARPVSVLIAVFVLPCCLGQKKGDINFNELVLSP